MGSYGSKWKHGWIPLNPVATALKLKQMKAGGGHRVERRSGHTITIAPTHHDSFGALVTHDKTGESHYIEHASSGGALKMGQSHAYRQSAIAKKAEHDVARANAEIVTRRANAEIERRARVQNAMHSYNAAPGTFAKKIDPHATYTAADLKRQHAYAVANNQSDHVARARTELEKRGYTLGKSGKFSKPTTRTGGAAAGESRRRAEALAAEHKARFDAGAAEQRASVTSTTDHQLLGNLTRAKDAGDQAKVQAATAELKRRGWTHNASQGWFSPQTKTTSEGVAKVTTTPRIKDGFTDTASNGKQYDHNAITGHLHRRDGALTGTMHQNADGSWKIEGIAGSLPAHNVKTRKQAINGLAVAHDLHLNRLEAAKAKKAESDAAASKSTSTMRDQGIERASLISKIVAKPDGKTSYWTGSGSYAARNQIEREALLKGSHEAAMEHLNRLYKERRAADIASAQRERSRLETARKRHFAPAPKRRPVTKDSATMVAARAEFQRRTERAPLDLNGGYADHVAATVREGTPVTHGGRAGHVIARYGQTFDTYHPPTQGQNGFYMRHEIRTRRGKKYIDSRHAGDSQAKAS